MRRLAVIGNSHIGALKQGWERMEGARPEIDLRFFGVVKPFEPECRLSDDLSYGLGPDASERARNHSRAINEALSIDLSDRDAVLWAGWDHGLMNQGPLFRTVDLAGAIEDGTGALLSREAFDAIMAAMLADRAPGPEWRRFLEGGRRLLVSLKPLVSERAAAQGEPRFWVEWAERPERYRAWHAAIAEAFARRLAAAGAELLEQPPETLAASGLTREAFSRGAGKLAPGYQQPEDDVTHMNGAYGEAMLRALFRRLGLADAPEGRAASAAARAT